MNRESILERAINITTQERVGVHGNPEDSFETIASVWNWYLGDILTKPLEGWQVSIMMALFKVARSMQTPEHVDNFVDAIGYLAIAAELHESKANDDLEREIMEGVQGLIDFVASTQASQLPAREPQGEWVFPDDFMA